MTYVATMYMPHNKENFNTKKQTVQDQHTTYHTSKEMVDKESCDALLKDVVEKLMSWKREDFRIVLTGDFSDDVYGGKVDGQSAGADMNMMEHILKTTGVELPPTHEHSSKAICRVFATVDIGCKTAEVLQRGSGIEDHLVFILDICC